MESIKYLEFDVKEKLTNLVEAARLVIPTSESCPLKKALEEYDQAYASLDHRLWKERIGL